MTTSINFHLRPSVRQGRHPGKLFIRIIRARQCRQISTDYALYEDEWDRQSQRIVFTNDAASDPDRRSELSIIGEAIAEDQRRLRAIVASLSIRGDYTAADIVQYFSESLSRSTLYGFVEITGKKLCRQGRERTARAYRSAARSLMGFNGGDIPLSRIDAPTMKSYEQYLIDNGMKMNTVSFYIRNIRAIYFRAVAEKLILPQETNPFTGMHTGVYETKRRALDTQQLRALAGLENVLTLRSRKIADIKTMDAEDCSDASTLRDSLLYFMFCYHARGMSFVDMVYLRKQSVGKENLIYKRRKTGGLLEIKITQPMRSIMSYFEKRTEGSDYVFPVIDPSEANIRRQYETGLKRQNRSLKTLGKMAGISGNLSTHVARHTWATLAKRLNVPVPVIGEALGHRDVKTTSIYLASFDRATMDKLSIRMSKEANVM